MDYAQYVNWKMKISDICYLPVTRLRKSGGGWALRVQSNMLCSQDVQVLKSLEHFLMRLKVLSQVLLLFI
jgi:hypothetical protein